MFSYFSQSREYVKNLVTEMNWRHQTPAIECYFIVQVKVILDGMSVVKVCEKKKKR